MSYIRVLSSAVNFLIPKPALPRNPAAPAKNFNPAPNPPASGMFAKAELGFDNPLMYARPLLNLVSFMLDTLLRSVTVMLLGSFSFSRYSGSVSLTVYGAFALSSLTSFLGSKPPSINFLKPPYFIICC